jgi:hypothetical protein
MHHEMLARLLKDAESVIAARREEVELQRKLIAALRADGKNTSDAFDTLRRLELAERLYRQHRDRLSEELNR